MGIPHRIANNKNRTIEQKTIWKNSRDIWKNMLKFPLWGRPSAGPCKGGINRMDRKIKILIIEDDKT